MTQSTIDSEVDQIFQHSHPLGDPLCEICHMWEQTKNLIAKEANKARIDEVNVLFNRFAHNDDETFRRVDTIVQHRLAELAQLTADKEQAALQNKTNDGGSDENTL